MKGDKERSAAGTSLPDPETWVDDFGDYLYRYATSILRDPGIAEDLVQETLLAALQTRESFAGRSSVRTWLTGILRHKMIDYFRKQRHEQPLDGTASAKESTDGLFDENGQWKIGPGKWTADPMRLLEEKEFWGVFYRCLAELPPRLAQAFTLREMEGVSGQEICKVLKISASNCWVMLYRARMHLRRCLEINWFDLKGSGGS